MIKVNDLVEQVNEHIDGAPNMPMGSVGIVTEANIMGSPFHHIIWIGVQPDPPKNLGGRKEWVWHSNRFKVITDGR